VSHVTRLIDTCDMTHWNRVLSLTEEPAVWSQNGAFRASERLFSGNTIYSPVIVALLRKETCNLRHPMHLRHSVQPDALVA